MRQVDEALAERKQPPVAAAGALGPDPDAQSVPADELRGRGQGRDGALPVAAIDEQVSRQPIGPPEEGDAGDLLLGDSAPAHRTQPHGDEDVEGRGVVGDIDRRARLGQTLPVLHAGPDPQDPDDRGPDSLPVDVADPDSQGPPRQQQQREQQVDDRAGGDQDEAGCDAHPGADESQRPARWPGRSRSSFVERPGPCLDPSMCSWSR